MSEAVLTASTAAKSLSVALVGNPNTGKTTLFNALTGLRHRVGNYAGVTVETKSGTASLNGKSFRITDVPGTYSLSARSPDEMLAVDLLLGHRSEVPRPDVILCIVDASNIERNLYLLTQILELETPVVVALNMIDVSESIGLKIDVARLQEAIGVPVVPVQANARRGLAELGRAIAAAAGAAPPPRRPEFPRPFVREVDALDNLLREKGRPAERFLVERAILDAGGQTERVLVEKHGAELTAILSAARSRLAGDRCPVPAVEARTRYAWVAAQTAGAVQRPAVRKVTFSDRIDRILMHRVWGVIVFIGLMAVVFMSIFTWAEPLMGVIEGVFGWLESIAAAEMPEGALRALVIDGVIAGVGGVLIFLPQIVILFGFIAILEDCGYMARAAFLMDKLMARCGLSGKSFIPMLSSFACAIPGVMATRTIEDRRDRLATILVAPLMSCSARLPVYTILIGAFVPSVFWLGFISLQGLVLLAMYLIGMIVAPLVAWTLKKTILGGETPVFLMELPSYKLPSLRTVFHRMAERGWAFVKRAGTLILCTTVIVWALQYYPRSAAIEQEYQTRVDAVETTARSQAEGAPEASNVEQEESEERIAAIEHERDAVLQEQSFLGRAGKLIEPAVKPLGWDWRIGMAALASFPAREVVVGALGTIYSVGPEVEVEDEVERTRLQEALRAATWPDGRPVFTLATALSLMVFFALCCQCAATLAVIKRETNSWRWPIFTFVYMTALAYVAALIVYQVGSRMGRLI